MKQFEHILKVKDKALSVFVQARDKLLAVSSSLAIEHGLAAKREATAKEEQDYLDQQHEQVTETIGHINRVLGEKS